MLVSRVCVLDSSFGAIYEKFGDDKMVMVMVMLMVMGMLVLKILS